MRASLASATSLLALLLGSRDAFASPTVTTGLPTLSFGDVLVGATGSLSAQAVATVTSGSATTLSIGAPAAPFSGSSLTGSISSSGASSFTSNFTFAPLSTGAATPDVLAITDSGSGSNTAHATLTGTGVAPLEAITTSNPYLLVGSAGTISLTVGNIGNGNLAGVSSASNLNGTVGSASSVFVGSGGTFNLQDTTSTSAAATTKTFAYTYTPTLQGATASAAVVTTFTNGTNAANSGGTVSTLLTATGVAPVASVSNTGTTIGRVGTTLNSSVTIANTGNGNLSGLGSISNLNGTVTAALGARVSAAGGNASSISLPNGSVSTLNYTYTPISRGTVSSTALIAFSNGNSNRTNTSQTISSVFVDQAVGPQYTSSVSGAAAVTGTVSAVANGSIGSATQTISFGTVGFKNSVTVYLDLGNASNDPGTAAQTELTIENYSIAGAGAASFSPSLTLGSEVTEGGQLAIPITVTNTTGYGVLNSSLTIFTDESAALGGTGDTFTYALTALAVPEPASIAVLGAGLAGLAGLRRRRR